MKKLRPWKKETKVVRLDLGFYLNLKNNCKANKRSISSQLYWICQVAEILENTYPELYIEIESIARRKNYAEQIFQI